MESVKWKMLSKNRFIGELGEYQIAIDVGGSIGAYWCITKDGIILEECYQHTPLQGELNTKGYTQLILKKIISQSVKL